MHPMDVEAMPVASLRPYVRNARTHSRKQIRRIANSIERFGRPPRALRFGPMIFGPKGFAPGPFEGDTR
jgi:hypothetical protein